MTDTFPPLPRDDIDHVPAHAQDMWETARGQSIFITGGTGFVGIWLLETFLAANVKFSSVANATTIPRKSTVCSTRNPHLAFNASLFSI
jgi:dTDP-glucose 4,6-dehydratase